MADSFDLLKKARAGQKFEKKETKGEKFKKNLKEEIKKLDKIDKPKPGSKTDLTNTMKFSKGGRVGYRKGGGICKKGMNRQAIGKNS